MMMTALVTVLLVRSWPVSTDVMTGYGLTSAIESSL